MLRFTTRSNSTKFAETILLRLTMVLGELGIGEQKGFLKHFENQLPVWPKLVVILFYFFLFQRF